MACNLFDPIWHNTLVGRMARQKCANMGAMPIFMLAEPMEEAAAREALKKMGDTSLDQKQREALKLTQRLISIASNHSCAARKTCYKDGLPGFDTIQGVVVKNIDKSADKWNRVLKPVNYFQFRS